MKVESIFLEKVSAWSLSMIDSSSSSRSRRLRMVRKLVSVPPSQRSVTYGMPLRWHSSTMVSAACRLVPTKRISPPPLATRLKYLIARSKPRTVSFKSMM